MKKKQLTAIAMAGVLAAGVLSYGGSAQADGYSTDYTIDIPATFTVADAGWNATIGITANNSTSNFDSSKKLTVTAASTNSWALVSGDNSVGYNLATATGDYSSTATPASWEFSAAELNAESGTNKGMGIIVENYDEKPAGNYTDTVTFTAKVESDAVAVTGIVLDKTSLELTAGGDTATLTATVSPDDATDKTVTWSSDNEAVVTVANGVVTPVAKGTAVITAKVGDKTATCAVTVKQLYSITFTGPYSNATLVMEYYEGDTWNDMATKYSTYIKIYSGYAAFYTDGFIYDNGSWVSATAQIDPSKTYTVE